MKEVYVRSTLMLFFGVIVLVCGIIGYCRSKPSGEYDELLEEENIYNNHRNNHY